ncbi:DnaD domain protein ['Camptotheca acuminata' phytoplasma]|uniref:DnaD domain protein n=1 Tax='Camptotheca acuminata' phytoplasma TaxID=3239192 RepID=UPI00351A83B4
MLSLDKLVIKNDFVLTNQEQKVLNLLYQPLMGAGTLGLYRIFYFLNQKNNSTTSFNHQFIFDLLNINEVVFLKYKEKLEAINLLSTFQSPQKEFIYLLKTPLNDNEFFKDPILSQFLVSEVGEEIYHQLKNLFSVKTNIEFENYENISKNFSDVYTFKKINMTRNITDIHNQNTNDNKFAFFQKYFNYNTFMDNLATRFKQPFLLELKNIEYITKLGFIFEINPKEMATLYEDVFRNKDDNHLNLENLRIRLNKKISKDKNQLTLVNIESINDEEKKMIFHLKNVHPKQIIDNFVQNVYTCYSLYDVAYHLLKQNNVEIGVINALFMFICSKKRTEKDFPTSYNYFQTVLNSWLKKGIDSTESAYDFLIEEKKFKKNKLNEKNSPKWLDDIRKELDFKN